MKGMIRFWTAFSSYSRQKVSLCSAEGKSTSCVSSARLSGESNVLLGFVLLDMFCFVRLHCISDAPLMEDQRANNITISHLSRYRGQSNSKTRER